MQANDTDADRLLPFAGLTRHSSETVPEDVWGHGSSIKWWAKERGRRDDDDATIDLPELSLNTLIDRLPRATTVEAAWVHPMTGETVSTGKHNAVVNPDKVQDFRSTPKSLRCGTKQQLRDALDDMDRDELLTALDVLNVDLTDDTEGEPSGQETLADGGTAVADMTDDDLRGVVMSNVTTGDEALFQIPTGDYTVVNPSDFLRPLAETLRDEDMGDHVFGEARLYRAGGKVSLDVFFDGRHVDLVGERFDEDRAPIVVGAQVDWDHFGGTSIQIQGMAMDFECTNALRSFTDKLTVKHTGDLDARSFKLGDYECGDWHQVWEKLLEILDLKRDQLSQFIEEAQEEYLDLGELPDDFDRDADGMLEAYFERSGLPGYLARRAAENVRAEAEDPYEPSMWELHRGATYAVSHYSNADTVADSTIDDQNRVANDFLFNPVEIQDRVVEEYREDMADDSDTLEEEGGGIAQITKATGDLAEKREAFERRQEQIQELAAQGE